MNLTVFVSDVNDNSPQFTLPGGYQFSVAEGVVGLTVGAVKVNQQFFFLDCRAGRENGREKSFYLPNAEKPFSRDSSHVILKKKTLSVFLQRFCINTKECLCE